LTGGNAVDAASFCEIVNGRRQFDVGVENQYIVRKSCARTLIDTLIYTLIYSGGEAQVGLVRDAVDAGARVDAHQRVVRRGVVHDDDRGFGGLLTQGLDAGLNDRFRIIGDDYRGNSQK
jgi:hypothetical protein